MWCHNRSYDLTVGHVTCQKTKYSAAVTFHTKVSRSCGNQNRSPDKRVIKNLFSYFSAKAYICCGYSKEPSPRAPKTCDKSGWLENVTFLTLKKLLI